MLPTSGLHAPNAVLKSKSFLSSRPSAMTELSAESTARSATGHGARASVDQEADSVAVAAREAGTNIEQKAIPQSGGLFFVEK
jgi:hypothetical protein